jgi:hypothetical protein
MIESAEGESMERNCRQLRAARGEPAAALQRGGSEHAGPVIARLTSLTCGQAASTLSLHVTSE